MKPITGILFLRKIQYGKNAGKYIFERPNGARYPRKTCIDVSLYIWTRNDPKETIWRVFSDKETAEAVRMLSPWRKKRYTVKTLVLNHEQMM